jgi:hypothetical protein
MMNSQEMETAVRLKLNLVVLVIEDGAYGMIRWKQAVERFPDFGMTFNNPDFVKYAEAYGAKGTRVSVIGQFRPTLEEAFRGGGVQLVAVPIDYSENTRVLVDELHQSRTSESAQRSPSSGSGTTAAELIICSNFPNNEYPRAVSRPINASVIIDADALANAQPTPVKAMSRIAPCSKRR